jgi:hypothetical protein
MGVDMRKYHLYFYGEKLAIRCENKQKSNPNQNQAIGVTKFISYDTSNDDFIDLMRD